STAGRAAPGGRRPGWLPVLAGAVVCLMLLCAEWPFRGGGPTVSSGQRASRPDARDVTRRQADDAQWVMPAKNYASTRYSGLADITPATVKDLRLAWTFSTGVTRGHEAAPLVVDSTMYVVTPFPNVLYALDLG